MTVVFCIMRIIIGISRFSVCWFKIRITTGFRSCENHLIIADIVQLDLRLILIYLVLVRNTVMLERLDFINTPHFTDWVGGFSLHAHSVKEDWFPRSSPRLQNTRDACKRDRTRSRPWHQIYPRFAVFAFSEGGSAKSFGTKINRNKQIPASNPKRVWGKWEARITY